MYISFSFFLRSCDVIKPPFWVKIQYFFFCFSAIHLMLLITVFSLCFKDIVDLSDETGCLKNLMKHPLEYATKFLTSREILVLVKGESK